MTPQSFDSLPSILYGGDYNPDQWPEEVWAEDARLMQVAGVNCVSLGIFSWAKLETAPGQYDFGWLDRVLDILHAHQIKVFLATATASPPPWFSRLYPESLPVDKQGLRFKPGSRQHYCPNSIAYREGSAALAGALAQRYGQHPAVLMWHINNEYACHVSECYCDVCTEEFRGWLEARYRTLEVLNEAWGTAFWSQHYTAWNEIHLPNRTTTFRNPGHVLDYKRFMNASILGLYCGEVAAIRAAGAPQPLFTNMVFGLTALDQFEWAQHADYTAVDIYPDPSMKERAWIAIAFAYDMMRSIKGGKPFLLLEQATTQVNWRSINQIKLPGQMRAMSYQAVARGADSVMFFQWRASRAGAEKYHSAMVPHYGTENSRVFDEVSKLGAELKQLQGVAGSRIQAQVGLLFSFENIWALELDSKPAQIDPTSTILPWHEALATQNIPVDIVHPDMDLSSYKVLIAPLLYQLTESQADKLRAFVQNGGTLVMSYFSGIVDTQERIWLGGYPALLRDVLGITVEEWQPLLPDEHVVLLDTQQRQINGEHWVDLLHVNGAEVIANYVGGFLDGRPALTRHQFGKGQAYYVGTRPAQVALDTLLREVCESKGITPLVQAPRGVEASIRTQGETRYLFIINHTDQPTDVNLKGQSGHDALSGAALNDALALEPYGVRIIALEAKL